MGWKIEFHKSASKEFDELSETLKEKFERIFKRVTLLGLTSLPSKYCRYVEDGIWEFRAVGVDGIARSLYIAEREQVVKILEVFVKKTEKTPRDKIELAQKRRGE